jgi:small subunit ribosomal protein S20
MPRTKSAIKRVKTNERNRKHNIVYKSQIRTSMKSISELVAKKDSKLAIEAAQKTFALIDRAQFKDVIHINNAARKKSTISKWLKTLESK